MEWFGFKKVRIGIPLSRFWCDNLSSALHYTVATPACISASGIIFALFQVLLAIESETSRCNRRMPSLTLQKQC